MHEGGGSPTLGNILQEIVIAARDSTLSSELQYLTHGKVSCSEESILRGVGGSRIVLRGTGTEPNMTQEQEMMTSVPFARLAVPQGSIAIYDSRTLHRGAANTSPFARPTIYFSLAERHKLIPIGPVYSLRHGYRQFPLTINNVILETIPDEVLADGVLVHSDLDLPF